MGDDSGGMRPADFAAMTNNANSDNWFIWMLFLFFICGGNGFGWGNNGNSILDSTLAASAAQGGYVTSNQMNDALRLQSIQQGQRDIIDAVNSNKYDIVNANSASEARIISNQADIRANQAANAQAQQACCAEINYNSAMNTAAINANVTEQTQKVLDAITGNRMADMQNQINQLQLQNAVAGVVRYPMASTYSSGCNPFCGCGCGTTV